MKPYFLGLLFGLFLSLPGLLLKIAGGLGALCCAMSLIVAGKAGLQSDLLCIGYIFAYALAFAFGSAMGALAEILCAAEKPYRAVPPRIVAITIGLRTLALLGSCAVAAAVAYLARGMWWAVLGACIIGTLLFMAGLALQNHEGAPLLSKHEPDND